jgi:hypothetical protein
LIQVCKLTFRISVGNWRGGIREKHGEYAATSNMVVTPEPTEATTSSKGKLIGL